MLSQDQRRLIATHPFLFSEISAQLGGKRARELMLFLTSKPFYLEGFYLAGPHLFSVILTTVLLQSDPCDFGNM